MFIQDTDTVDICIHYKKVGKKYLAYNEKELEEADFDEEAKKEYKSVTITMKQLTWGLYNDLQESAVDVDEAGNRRFNYTKYKEQRLTQLIIDWDATRMNGDKAIRVKVSKSTLRSLAPEIAESILTAYEEMMYVSEDEEGKS